MPFTFSVYSGLLLPFFVQGVVVSGVLLRRRRRYGSAADAWLAVLLLLHTLRLAQWMLGFAGWYDSHDAFSTFMFYFPFSNRLAVGPVLYFYFRSLTNQEFRFSRRQWWHLAPALAYLALRLGVLLYDIGLWHGLRGQPLPAHFGTKGPLAQQLDEVPLEYVVEVGAYLLIGAYALRTLREYRAYARYLNDNFSDTDQIRFRWLRNVLVAVLIGTGVSLAFAITNSFVTPLSYYQAWYDYFFTGLLIYYLSIAGLLTGHQLAGLHFQPPAETSVLLPKSEPEAVPEPVLIAPPQQLVVTENPERAATATTVAPKAAVTPGADAELTRWTTRLLAHMAEARPYLAPELTLGELAAQLRTNTSWLSRVINAGCGQNFNDFINEYRVREAEARLQDPRFRHYTLLAVALEAGFNSKSTFNRVFKKLRGITPGEVARPE
ncbi:helix-turn-helix domain-containing protein [Hymenobacter cellulosivorans]|uniref:Helix-turn-helix domain-containing protein n=1 Tax=Hymenobacter cellulosivorans TaxID=2932249 RepID=A0ABY4F4M0_9BACT|nr:helix-turn-helix transcriptional regulator [Hymenobacter cellulosivorans]UOQ51002.1 helix-turn-helix domain-containing protein [Hymenobacter cellulosivorans]